MQNNERGGILSNLFIIPLGIALMVSFFFLGYYVGKYQCSPGSQGDLIPPLPEIAKKLPSKEEFSFYKTLMDKSDKKVSIDLKPESKAVSDEGKEDKKQDKKTEVKDKQSVKKQDEATPKKQAVSSPKEKKPEVKKQATSAPAKPKQVAAKQPQTEVKKESQPVAATAAGHYTLQLASYQDKKVAENEVKRIKQKGYPAYFVNAEIPNKGVWYRVRVGKYTTKEGAEKIQKKLQSKDGVSSLVVTE
ncbi:MAG: SPOR domain-containing protein [Nitrospirota bacterium]